MNVGNNSGCWTNIGKSNFCETFDANCEDVERDERSFEFQLWEFEHWWETILLDLSVLGAVLSRALGLNLGLNRMVHKVYLRRTVNKTDRPVIVREPFYKDSLPHSALPLKTSRTAERNHYG